MHLNRTSSPGSTRRPRYAGGASGGRLLFSDMRTLSLFVNEARYRAFERVLGTYVQRLATIAHGDGVCTTFIPTGKAKQ